MVWLEWCGRDGAVRWGCNGEVVWCGWSGVSSVVGLMWHGGAGHAYYKKLCQCMDKLLSGCSV